MQLTRNHLDTSPGPGDWFTGSVFVDTVAAPSEGSQVGGGAAATRFMTHIAIQQADDNGNVVEWGRHVSDDEYAQAPSLEGGDR
jgi:hypothetical protein